MLKVQCALRLTRRNCQLNNQPNSDLAFYGCLLSVAWAKSMLCFANVILFYLFILYGRLMLRPWLTEVRETFTRGGSWVWIEKLLLWFFSWSWWRNLAYFQTPPANFLLSRRNAAEYCNSEKNLLSTDGCCTRVPGLVNFGLQNTRHIIVLNN